MNVTKLERKVRWLWNLPTGMSAITIVLMVLTPIQETKFWEDHHTARYWEVQPPARLFAELLNGPGFFLTYRLRGIQLFGQDVYDFGRLVGVVIFWTWIGWALDRRLAGIRMPIIKLRWLRASIYAVLVGLVALFIGAVLSDLHSLQMLPSTLLWAHLRTWGLHASVLARYVMLAWAAVGFVFFSKQMLTAFKTHPDSPLFA